MWIEIGQSEVSDWYGKKQTIITQIPMRTIKYRELKKNSLRLNIVKIR